MNARIPSLDAARYDGDRIGEAEAASRIKSDDTTASRKACDAIKAIADIDFTPGVAAQIAAVLSAKVTGAGWSHFDGVPAAIQGLDDAHDLLTEAQL